MFKAAKELEFWIWDDGTDGGKDNRVDGDEDDKDGKIMLLLFMKFIFLRFSNFYSFL